MIDGLMFHDMEFKNITVMKTDFDENQVINYMNCGKNRILRRELFFKDV